MKVKEFTKKLFDRGKASGFDEMETYASGQDNFSVRIFKGEIDSYSVESPRGLGFRSLIDGKMGYSYTEKLDEESIEMLIKDARENAAVIDSDDKEEIYGGSDSYPEVTTFHPDLESVSAEDKIELAKAIEKEALALDERVQIVQSFVRSGRSNLNILNTRGVDLGFEGNGIGAGLQVVVRQGDETKASWKFNFETDLGKLDAGDLARKAVTEAASLLDGGSFASGRYPVVFRYDTAGDMLATFSSSFSAENVQKGMSLFAGKLGETVASDLVTVMDDPLLPGRQFTRPFDGEGVASRTKAVIENGVLQTYLHSLKTAAKDGVEPTGNASRGVASPIGVSPTNMYIAEGEYSYEDLVKKMDKGLVIISLAGTHSGADPISGDFSLGAEGYLVEGGEIVRPLAQFTIAGNFFDLMKRVIAVGNDLDFGMGRVGAPSLLVEELAVGSE